jgi:hypothetical protein
MHYLRARQILVLLLFYVVASAAVPLLAHGQNTPSQFAQHQSDQKEKTEQQALRIEETQITGERIYYTHGNNIHLHPPLNVVGSLRLRF